MSGRRRSRPHWFRVDIQNRGALEAIPSEQVGEALKLAFRFFDLASRAAVEDDEKIADNLYGEAAKIEDSITDAVTRIAFGVFRQGINESLLEYRSRLNATRRYWRERNGEQDDDLPFE